jgi:hypothetical protein
MSDRPVPSYALPSSLAIAQQVVDSDNVISVYAACEWDELHDDGKLWVSAIVEEARRRFAEPPAPSFQFSSNLRPAPFALTPPVVKNVLSGSADGSGVVAVPILPIKLVDQPCPSIEIGVNDDQPVAPIAGCDVPALLRPDCTPNPVHQPPAPSASPLADGQQEPARVAPEQAVLSAPANITTPRLAGADLSHFSDTSGTRARRAKVAIPLTAEPERQSDVRHRQAKDRDARALEAPTDTMISRPDRLAMIREAAQALASRPEMARCARPSLGERQTRAAKPLPPMPTELRRQRLQAAIAFLARTGILVTVVDRDALIRQYRVSGKREKKLADEVIAIAVERGLDA